MVNYYYYYP